MTLPAALLVLALVQAAPSAPSPGFTLFTPMQSRVTYLVDAQGESVHTWSSELPSAGAVALLENGHLLRAVRVRDPVFAAGGVGGRLQELDRDGGVVWDFELASERYLQHHDFEPTPHGTILVLAWERKSIEEAVAAGFDPAVVRAPVWSEVVVEIEPAPPSGGRIVWEWHAWDHLVQERFPERANFGSVSASPGRLDVAVGVQARRPEGPAELAELRALGYGGEDEDEDPARTQHSQHPPRGRDWIHANALDYDPESDRILVCSRALSELWVIDHSTTIAEAASSTGGRQGRGGDFLARWGNPRNHGAGSADDQRLFFPHDAHWLVFNNGPIGPSREGQVSEVVELRAPADGALESVWACTSIDGTGFFSGLLSGAQRLPNGNTLVTIGAEARLVEITPAGSSVWEHRHEVQPDELVRDARAHPARAGDEREDPDHPRPNRAGIFRATRLAPDHPGIVSVLGGAAPK
jgi:hypothetical protein